MALRDNSTKDSLKELEALQIETKLLLDSIRGKSSSGIRQNGKLLSKEFKPSGKSNSLSNSDKKAKKRRQLDTSLQLSRSLTQNLYSENRATLEIFDDASPDVTPRQEYVERQKQMDFDRKKLNLLTQNETKFRTISFMDEKTRVLGRNDIFVPGNGVTAEDVEKERIRLMKLEEISRQKYQKQMKELKVRKDYLLQDRMALKIQTIVRGNIGRLKYGLVKKLKELREEDLFGDWIEVRDAKSGDVWYYNKTTNSSQWNKPSALSNNEKTYTSNPLKGISERLPAIGNGVSPNKKMLSVSATFPSKETVLMTKTLPNDNLNKTLSIDEQEAQMIENEATHEVNEILGIDKISAEDNFLAPDGFFKPHLRKTILDALIDTRFDSVSTVLADTRWIEENKEPFAEEAMAKIRKREMELNRQNRVDLSRTPLIAPLILSKRKKRSGNQLEAEVERKASMTTNTEGTGKSDGKHKKFSQEGTKHSYYGLTDGEKIIEELGEPKDLTLHQVEHPGFGDSSFNSTMCFGCWSAGAQRKCQLHDMNMPVKASQTMLLCRNWDLDIMRRRYRSEEIQEVFMARESSLRFDPKRKRFFTIIEKKHPIYRSITFLLEKFNSRMVLFEKIKRWLLSFSEEFRNGRIYSEKSAENAKLMKLKRSVVNLARIDRFTRAYRGLLLPIPPITGLSWPERLNEIQFLFKHKDMSTQQEVDLVRVYPTPIPRKLYEPRVYHLSVPRSIPMPKPTYDRDNPNVNVLPTNKYIEMANPASWFERLNASIVRDCMHAATTQISAITPVTLTDVAKRTKRPPPVTIKFATLGQKATASNMAVGGLALELLINQIITTFVTAQYGKLTVMDKAAVSPGVTPEATISFVSEVVPPIVQQYIIRPLEHPLNYRRAPTISLNSSVEPDQKDFYGSNRPEQTGEQDAHGFRTSSWAPMLLTYTETDPVTFTPGLEVVSLNDPKANLSFTTHADHTYPFCEPSTRDNSTLDFYHLLLTGVVSLAKAQVFTALTIQEPGQFLKDYHTDWPMGHLVVSVYRSWAFTQNDTIQEFKTDDGISYWYHRKTGQTFWERPLYEEEEPSALQGGTLLDTVHPEEPTMITKGNEGATRRHTQGEFRNIMLRHHEDKNDASSRRRHAAATLHMAKQRGVVPDLFGGNSVLNNPNSSVDMGSRFDFSKGQNHSIITNTEASNPENSSEYQLFLKQQELNKSNPNVNTSIPALEYHEFGEPIMPSGDASMEFNQNAYAGTNNVSFRRGSGLDDASVVQQQRQQQQLLLYDSQQSGTNPSDWQQPQNSLLSMPLNQSNLTPNNISAVPGLDTAAILNMTQAISKMFTNMMSMNEKATPQDMISMGLGMGMALMSTNAVPGVVSSQLGEDERYKISLQRQNEERLMAQRFHSYTPENGVDGFIPMIAEDMSSHMSHGTNDFQNHTQQMQSYQHSQPIGVPYPTINNSTTKPLDHSEEQYQRDNVYDRIAHPLTAVEKAKNLKVESKVTPTPDVAPLKDLFESKPLNAEDSVKEDMPLLAYPEITTLSSNGLNGAPQTSKRYPPAGQGTSFVTREEENSQQMVKDTEHQIRRTVMPLPAGFFEAIVAKHIAKQAVDYLPQVPNLPQARTIGRVKPRSAAADWLIISFDPWSAGKNPLGTEFIPSLLNNEEKVYDAEREKDLEAIKQSATTGAYVKVEDEAGLLEQRKEITKQAQLAEDFKKLCSLCRHSKFSDAEQLINQPDWSVPIDFQDDQGNSLLHVVAQNGNKRLVKLCLRRGAQLDLQNLTGQTPLHFAYGYGYAHVGDYLISKGADDSKRNKDGLTCYEGMGAKELALL